jgi:hypothetical protein
VSRQSGAVKTIPLSDIHARAHLRPPGYVEEVLACGVVKGDALEIDEEAFQRLAKKYRGPASGPGTELKRLLARLGTVSESGCACDARAAEMDRRGPEWCRENIELIAGWLVEGAERRGRAVPRVIAKALIRTALRLAKRKARPARD